MKDLPLSEATAQRIQLALIGRASFNSFDGPRVVAGLEKHQELWLATCMDRIGLHWRDEPECLPSGSLIKLRDLHHNHWNVDTLFILTENPYNARKLARIAVDDHWHADDITVHTTDETRDALGMGLCNYGLLSLWWD
ncbi:hypothetical protein [Nocardia sp. BMG51109]|uniref:hypothetical protein n=1 Tax=Nocardia sp. BMG51109 TaxID=1056816 RepID=UPI0004663AA4|nr:hypothetical protein [Nocardia sp. BMG51109]